MALLLIVSVAGFAMPEYALPWFVRLYAALTDADPMAPVFVRRSVHKVGGDGQHRGVDSLWDFMREVGDAMRREATDEILKKKAYDEWLEREAEWKRSTRHT